jgi:hypothetical protein
MRCTLFLLPALGLSLMLASCGSTSTTARSKPPKPMMYQGRVLTGVTDYYRPGYTPPPIAPAKKAEKPALKGLFGKREVKRTKAPAPDRGDSPYDASPRPGKLFSWMGDGGAPEGGGSYSPHASPVFANSDGTTSKVVGFHLVRSDGTRGDMIGNTIFHPDGTRSRIVGQTLINPDGSKSRRIK